MDKIQLRGICQCCGKLQAVLSSGKMSKHGYRVNNGWFEGTCSGQNHTPLQVDRTATDKILTQVRQDIQILHKEVADLESGQSYPAQARSGRGYKTPYVPFLDAPEWARAEAVRFGINFRTNRARAGESFIQYMEWLTKEVHGKLLCEVPVSEGPAQIQIGEQRLRADAKRQLTAQQVIGARVYWKDSAGFVGWTGSQAWRKLPVVG